MKVNTFLKPFRGEGYGELGSVLGQVPGDSGHPRMG